MWREGETRIPLGTTSFMPMVALQDMGEKIQGYFHWDDENTLEINWVYCETPHRDRLICKFENDKISFTCPSNKASELIGHKEMSFVFHS